jgi:hypothetical protein
VSKGARVLVGGKRNARFPNGNFYEPTVLVDVANDMRIAQEEVFGPVMTIIKVTGRGWYPVKHELKPTVIDGGFPMSQPLSRRVLRVCSKIEILPASAPCRCPATMTRWLPR